MPEHPGLVTISSGTAAFRAAQDWESIASLAKEVREFAIAKEHGEHGSTEWRVAFAGSVVRNAIDRITADFGVDAIRNVRLGLWTDILDSCDEFGARVPEWADFTSGLAAAACVYALALRPGFEDVKALLLDKPSDAGANDG